MVEACRKADRKLMIAYRMQYDPVWQQAVEIIQSGALGKVQSFRGSFPAEQPAGAWRLTKQYGGGGSVMDVGIYPLNGIRFLSQEEPAEVPRWWPRVTATTPASPRWSSRWSGR